MKRIVLGEKKECKYRKTCYGFVMHDDKVLLSFNREINEYSLPGGGVEPGESLEQCLKREFLEEVGFNILKTEEFINIDCFWVRRDGNDMETDANFLFAEVDMLDIKPPLEEFHEYIWVDKSQLLKLIEVPYQRKAIEILFNKNNS